MHLPNKTILPVETYHNIIENLREGILLADLQGKVLYANLALQQMTGYTEAELKQVGIWDLVPDYQLDYLKERIAKRAEGIAESYEIIYLTKSQEFRWAAVRASPFRDAQGQIIGTLTSITDVTENKHAEVILEQTQQKYVELFENMQDPVFMLDSDGYLRHFNRSMTQSLEYGLHFSTNNFRTLVHKADLGIFEAMLAEVQDLGFCKNVELRLVTLRGHLRYWQITATASYEQDVFTEMRCLARDITEQKIQSLQINARDALYKSVFESNFLAIGISDNNFQIVYVNKAFCKLLDYNEFELIGKHVTELTHPRDAAKTLEHFLSLKNRKIRGYDYEKCYLKKDGSTVFTHTYVSGIFDSKGELIYTVGTIDNITEKKKNQDALVLAKQEAERAQAAERQFLANMSHEIRTPMNAVIGMTHLLFNTNPSQEQREYLEALQFSADSLIGIISNILDLSKIEANEIEFDEQAFSLKQLLHALQRTYQLKVQDKAVAVLVDLDPSLNFQLLGDQVRLNQILSNLLSNAAKFTQKGHIGVEVKLEARAGVKVWLGFQIFDTGMGIPKESIELIFQNFKQANPSIHRQFGGTGLGLSIVKQLVELQGGKIEVHSVLGQGTRFKVSLPFEALNLADSYQTKSNEPSPPPLKQEALFEGFRILVAEDNSMNQKLIGRILKDWGCHYDIAQDGLEALDLLEQNSYDLILMDLHMPRLDGCEATEQLRNKTGNPNQHKPIIALTAAALLDEKNRVLEAGMNEFVSKPFSPKMLREVMLKYLISPSVKEPKLSQAEGKQISSFNSDKLDLSYLKELSGGDGIFIREILETFIRETPTDLSRLEEASHKQDLEQLQKIAHRLRSSLQMLGLEQARQLAADLEQNSRAQNLTNSLELSQALKQALEQGKIQAANQLAQLG